MEEPREVKVHSEHPGLTRLCLDRPAKANTLSPQMWAELPLALQRVSDLDGPRTVILTGAGHNFCGGIDFAALRNVLQLTEDSCPGRARERLRRHIMQWQDSLTAFETCRWPVIAAVQGACIGAGIDMITACDLRYCTEDAFFCVKEVDLAIVADMGTLQRLPKIVGDGVARELALTARTFKAAEAKRIGLVTEVYPCVTTMMEAVDKVALDIAAKSPLAITGTKRVLLHSRDHTVPEGLEYVATWNSGQLLSDDIFRVMKSLTAKTAQPSLVYAKM